MSTAQWANIGEDAGALHALVARIPEHAAISSIDYLWLFPARKIAIGESIVVVVASFDADPDRRRVATAHFTVSRNKKGAATVNVRYGEHGSAPASAVSRIVQGVLRRLGEDAEASPREEPIGGEQERWDALIVELGGTPRPAEEETSEADGAAESALAADGEATAAEAADSTPASEGGVEAAAASETGIADAAEDAETSAAAVDEPESEAGESESVDGPREQ